MVVAESSQSRGRPSLRTSFFGPPLSTSCGFATELARGIYPNKHSSGGLSKEPETDVFGKSAKTSIPCYWLAFRAWLARGLGQHRLKVHAQGGHCSELGYPDMDLDSNRPRRPRRVSPRHSQASAAPTIWCQGISSDSETAKMPELCIRSKCLSSRRHFLVPPPLLARMLPRAKLSMSVSGRRAPYNCDAPSSRDGLTWPLCFACCSAGYAALGPYILLTVRWRRFFQHAIPDLKRGVRHEGIRMIYGPEPRFSAKRCTVPCSCF